MLRHVAFLCYDLALLRLPGEGDKMELKRRLGVIIVCGVPAIVGSGLLWALSKTWFVVYGYLFLLAAALLVFLVAPQMITSLVQLLNPVSGKIKGLSSKLRESFGTQSVQ
jgi:hypothetical protein